MVGVRTAILASTGALSCQAQPITSVDSGSAASVDLVVTTFADDAAGGTVACPAVDDGEICTLRAAVQAANDAPADDHTIELAAGRWTGPRWLDTVMLLPRWTQQVVHAAR